MAYDSKNPKKNSIILLDEVGTPANPPAGSTKLITRSNVIYMRNSAGTEVAVLTGSAATQTSAKSADYTVTDTDNIGTILMTTSTTNRVVTLPTAADNTHRILTVKKVDTGSGFCRVDGEGAEAIGAGTVFDLHFIGDYVTLQCNGTGWNVIDMRSISSETAWTPTFAASTLGTLAASTATVRREGLRMAIRGTVTASSSVGASNLTLTLPVLGASAAAATVATTHASGVYCGRWIRNDSSATTRKGGPIFAIGNGSNTFVYFGSDDYNSATSPFTAVAANGLIANNNVVSFDFSVAVTDFAHWGT